VAVGDALSDGETLLEEEKDGDIVAVCDFIGDLDSSGDFVDVALTEVDFDPVSDDEGDVVTDGDTLGRLDLELLPEDEYKLEPVIETDEQEETVLVTVIVEDTVDDPQFDDCVDAVADCEKVPDDDDEPDTVNDVLLLDEVEG
jgi:hypothetical protein